MRCSVNALGDGSARDMVNTSVACGGLTIITDHEPPSQTDGRGNFSIVSWNICSSRNGGLEGALRAMESLDVDIGILQ